MQAADGTYKLRIHDDHVDATKATTTLVTLSGTAVVGDTWKLTLTIGANTKTFTHTVVAADLAGNDPQVWLGRITQDLSRAINDDSSSVMIDFTAVADGPTIVLVNRAGAAFSTAFQIISTRAAGAMTIDSTSAKTTIATLSGTPVLNEIWKVTIAGVEFEVTIGETVGSMVVDTLPEIAQALAERINTSSSAAVADLTAAALGDTLLVVNRAGAAPAVSFDITLVDGNPAGAAAIDSATAGARVVTLTGSPAVGNVWTVKLNVGGGVSTHSYTIQYDSLATIAAALASKINVAGTGYTATVAGSVLTINKTAGTFTQTGSITPSSASSGGTISQNTTAASSTTVTLGGASIGGEVWNLVLNDGTASQTFSYTVQPDSLAHVAAALAIAINESADLIAADFTATAEGSTLVIVKRNGGAFTAAFTVTPLGSLLPAEISSATTATLTLGGTPVAGEVWSLTLDDGSAVTNHSYTALANDTLASIASALAADVNARAATEFTATPSDASLLITNSLKEFKTFASVTAAGAFSGGANATTTIALLSGTPKVGDRWTVRLAIGVDATSHGFTVTNGSTLDDIAAGLAAAINGQAAADFTAAAEGSLLLITNRAGTSFQTGFELVLATPTSGTFGGVEINAKATTATLSGTPLAGEVWQLELKNSAGTATLSTHSHTVLAGDTLEAIAADFAAQINANGPSEFTATADGPLVVIVNRAGTVFTTSFAITLAPPATGTAGAAAIDSTKATTSTVAFSGTPVNGETWTVSLSMDGTTPPLSYSVTSGQSLAEIAGGLATAINADSNAAEFTATTEGATLIIINRGGAAFTTSFAVTSPSATIPVSFTGVGEAKTITLSGAVVNGDIWKITVASQQNSITIDDADDTLDTNNDDIVTLTEIASALALMINNAPGLADFSATAEGESLVIVKLTAGTFDAAVTITPASSSTSVESQAATLTSTINASLASAFAKSATLGGTASIGEVWTLQLKDDAGTTTLSTHSHTVLAGETLAAIASVLAADINARAPTAFTATTEGSQIIVIDRTNTAFTMVLSVAPAGSVTTATPKATATVTPPTRLPVIGEVWTATLTVTITGNANPVTHSFSHVVSAEDSRATILASLAAQINAGTPANFSAALRTSSTGAPQLIVVNRADDANTSFTTDLTITPAGFTATTTLVTLEGTPGSGEVWTLTLNGNAYAVTVNATIDTLGEIAAALMAAVNADEITAAGFSASSEDSTLIIVRRSGAAFTTAFNITPSGAGTFTINATTAKTAIAVLNDTPHSGEQWTVSLSLGGTTTPFSYSVTNGQSLAQIASGLAAVINTTGPADFTAAGDGATLLITNRAGTTFAAAIEITAPAASNAISTDSSSPAFTVDFAGTVATGETWTINVASAIHSVAIGQSYTINGVKITVASLIDVVRVFAALINADSALADFAATDKGASLVIVKLTAGNFTAAVVPAGTLTPVAPTPGAQILALSGTPTTGEFWAVTLDSIYRRPSRRGQSDIGGARQRAGGRDQRQRAGELHRDQSWRPVADRQSRRHCLHADVCDYAAQPLRDRVS